MAPGGGNAQAAEGEAASPALMALGAADPAVVESMAFGSFDGTPFSAAAH